MKRLVRIIAAAVALLLSNAALAEGQSPASTALERAKGFVAAHQDEAALTEFEQALALGAEPKGFAREAALAADRAGKGGDRPRQARFWLLVAKGESDQAAALKAGAAADSAAAQVEAYELALTLGKLAPDDAVALARATEASGDARKTMQRWDEAATANAAAFDVQLSACKAHLAAGDVPGAQARADQLSAQHPAEPTLLLFRADLAHARGDAAGERKILEELVAHAPRFAPAQVRLGKILQAAGDLPGAQQRFQEAIKSAPKSAEGHWLLSGAALAAGDKARAVAEGKAAVKLARREPLAQLSLGVAALASGDCATATPALQSGRSVASADALVGLGQCLSDAKQPAKARAAAAEAARKEPKNAPAHELLGDLALAEGKGADAVTEYGRAAAGREKTVPFLLKQATAADLAGDADGAAATLDGLLAKDPAHPAAAAMRAKVYRGKKQPEKAVAVLGPAIEKNPKDGSLQDALAASRLEAGDAKGAESAAGVALSLDAKDPAAHDVLGRVLYGSGQREAARAHLDAACASKQASGDALVDLAELEQDAGHRDPARSLLQRARAAGAARVAVPLARSLQKDGDLAGAERTIAPYLGAHPDDAAALQAGADIAYDRAQYAQARERFEKAAQHGTMTPAAQGRLCDLRVKDGAYAKAKESCEEALQGKVDTATVHASLGLALYRLGDRARGKDQLTKAAKLGANDVPTHSALGAIAQEEGRDDAALDEYGKVLGQQKNNVEANVATGRILEKKGNHKEAAARLGRAFAARPGDSPLGADLARAQLGAGNLPAAQATLAQVRQDELPPEVLHGLRGRIERGLGNFRRAHEEYQKAITAKPNDAELLALDGENYLDLPDYDRAIAQLEKAKAADPQRVSVVSKLSKLYAETGQTKKASAALAEVDRAEKKDVEARREKLSPDQIKRLALGEAFKNGGKDAPPVGFALGLRDAVAGDLLRSPHIAIIDSKSREAVAKERDRLAQDNPEEAAKLAPEQAPQGVVSGLFVLDGDRFQLSVEVHDLNHNLLSSATEEGPRKEFGRIEKKVALRVLDRLAPLSPEDRAQLEEADPGSNVDSFAYAAQAAQAEKQGDLRSAADLYQRARDTDQGNARALAGLERSLVEVEKKNQIAVPSPQVLGDIDDAQREMFRRTLTDRLSGVRGLRVIEQEKVKEVGDEIDRIFITDKDAIDPASIDVQAIGKKLAATVIVRSTMQREGDHLALSASLVDITDQKLLVGGAVDGPLANRQKLQGELARQIVQKLRGEPTDEEKAALEATLKEEDYQAKMKQFAELLAKEKAGKAARLAQAQQTPPPALAAAKNAEPASAIEPSKPTPKLADAEPHTERAGAQTYDVFNASLRLSRPSPSGNSSNMLGLVLTHFAERTGRTRWSVLLDLESTRALASRQNGTNAAWYAVGGDFTVPIDIGGTGIFLGGEALAGIAQAQQQGVLKVQTGYGVALAPHAGIALAFHGVGITADLGYRIPLLVGDASGDAVGLRGFYLQAGLRTETIARSDSSSGRWILGYTAHMLVPNGGTAASRFHTTTLIGGGALLENALTLLKNSNSTTTGLWVSYGHHSGGNDSITRTEAAWVYLWNAFGPDDLFNPYLGGRLGLVSYSGDQFFGSGLHAGVLGALMAGIDLQLARAFVVRIGGSYDASSVPLSSSNDLAGYAVDAGIQVRF